MEKCLKRKILKILREKHIRHKYEYSTKLLFLSSMVVEFNNQQVIARIPSIKKFSVYITVTNNDPIDTLDRIISKYNLLRKVYPDLTIIQNVRTFKKTC